MSIPSKSYGGILHGTKRSTSGETYRIKNEGYVYKAQKDRGTIWNYLPSSLEKGRNKEKLKHPATFPNLLASDHVLCWTNQGDLVLDPMCGSGTVCAEAKKNKRHFIGIDINQDYCNTSNNILGIVNASS